MLKILVDLELEKDRRKFNSFLWVLYSFFQKITQRFFDFNEVQN